MDRDVLNNKELIPSDDTKILRYMDFPEFLYMLQYEKLCFASTRLMSDRYEELLPGIAAQISGHCTKAYENDQAYAVNPGSTYINCWTEYDRESYAMWHIYSKKYGIAVETDCRRLNAVIKKYNGIVRRVKYINLNECEQLLKKRPNNTDKAALDKKEDFVLKPDFYEYEKEIRAIIIDDSKADCRQINVDIRNFLSSIVISPFASSWFSKMVKDIVYDKYDLTNINIRISGLEIKL